MHRYFGGLLFRFCHLCLIKRMPLLANDRIAKVRVGNDMRNSKLFVNCQSSIESNIYSHGNSSESENSIASLDSLSVKGVFEDSTIAVGVIVDDVEAVIHGDNSGTSGTIGKVMLGSIVSDNQGEAFGVISNDPISKMVVNRSRLSSGDIIDDFIIKSINS